jgi:transposase
MARSSFPPIAETLETLQRRLRRETDLRLKARLHLLVLIQASDAQTQVEAAERLAVHPNTVWRWLQTYREGGLEGLLTLSRRGAPTGQRTLPAPVFDALKRRLTDPEGFASYIEVQQWLKGEFDLEVPYKSVHKLVRYRLKAKLKAPRPHHDKKARAHRPRSPNG